MRRSRADRCDRCSCHSRWSCRVSDSATRSAALPRSSSSNEPPEEVPSNSDHRLWSGCQSSASPCCSACSSAPVPSPGASPMLAAVSGAGLFSAQSSRGLVSTASAISASSSAVDICSRRIAWRNWGVITSCWPIDVCRRGFIRKDPWNGRCGMACRARRITAGRCLPGRRGARRHWPADRPVPPAPGRCPRRGYTPGRRFPRFRGHCGR